MWCPPAMSGFSIHPIDCSYKYSKPQTIVIGVMFTNLAIIRGPHIVSSFNFCENRLRISAVPRFRKGLVVPVATSKISVNDHPKDG